MFKQKKPGISSASFLSWLTVGWAAYLLIGAALFPAAVWGDPAEAPAEELLPVVRPLTCIMGANGYEDLPAESEARKLVPAQTDSIPGWPSAPAVAAESAIVMDADTGAVLYGKNIHEPLYPASTTKLLTVLMAYEQLDPRSVLTFSHDAVFSIPRDGSAIGIDEGEQLTAEQAMYAVMTASANEAANALGESMAGSISAFAEKMNERAAALGCTDSHFANPSGLCQKDHYTSAYDLALIATAYFSHETLCEMSNTVRYNIPPAEKQKDDIWIYNHNRFVNGELPLEGMVGGKTGYTVEARGTLVTCAKRNGRKLICVVMREEPPCQYTDTQTLLCYGFSGFKNIPVILPENSEQKRENSTAIPDSGIQYDTDAFLNSGITIFGSPANQICLEEGKYITIPADASPEDLTFTTEYRNISENTASGETETTKASPIAEIHFYYHDVHAGSAALFSLQTTGSVLYPDSPSSEEKNSGLLSFLRSTGNIFPKYSGKILLFCGLPAGLLLILFILLLFRSQRKNKKGSCRKRRHRRSASAFSFLPTLFSSERKAEEKPAVPEIHPRRKREPAEPMILHDYHESQVQDREF